MQKAWNREHVYYPHNPVRTDERSISYVPTNLVLSQQISYIR